MNKVFSFFFSLCISAAVFAQQGGLEIKHAGKSFYIDHKVAPKEGLFAIGRIYNVHPRVLANFNNLDMQAGLAIGQMLKVPLSDTNFTQQSSQGIPLYYIAKSGDALSTVSNAYQKVSVQKLKDWNNLSGDNIAAGKQLIVGYLVSKNAVAVKPTPVAEAVKEVAVVKEEPKPIQQENKPEPTKREEAPPVTAPIQAAVVEAKKTDREVVSGQGFFKPHFEQQVKKTPTATTKDAVSGIFKTTSGWNDGKYYLLIDGVPTGSIISVSNPANNKIIYAKVLGEMNGIRMNRGYDIRISNAAAAALNITSEDKFNVRISY